MANPIPVICDRCRAEGEAGEGDFADLGDLLDFAPVPRRPRADGWSPEVQRAFIAALAVTGSERQSARAVGKAQFGVEQLKKANGNEGFMAARDRALGMAADDNSRRLAAGVHAVTRPAAHWRPPEPAWAHASTRRALPPPAAPAAAGPDEEEAQRVRHEAIAHLTRMYAVKVRQERAARLAGQVVNADFYLRQMTHMEVMLDLMGAVGGFQVLMEFRHQGHHLADIAETPMSRLMGQLRRAQWARLDEPPRPEPTPRDYLVDHDGFSTQPPEVLRGGTPLSHEEQWQRFKERHRQAAESQLRWEEAARRDYERRRDSAADS